MIPIAIVGHQFSDGKPFVRCFSRTRNVGLKKTGIFILGDTCVEGVREDTSDRSFPTTIDSYVVSMTSPRESLYGKCH